MEILSGGVLVQNTGEMYAAPGFTNDTKILPKRMDMTIWDMYMWIPGEWQYNWLVTVLVSFIGVFGYMNVFLAKIWYKIYIAGFGIGILASIPLWKKMVRIRKTEETVERTEETEEEKLTYVVVKEEKRMESGSAVPHFHGDCDGDSIYPADDLRLFL